MRIRTPFRLLMMMALMGIAACTNEGEEQLLQGNEIKLVSEIIPLSRVAGQGLQSTQIAEGQPLGITIAGSQNGQANAEWVAGKNGSLTPKGEKVLWGDTDITITAYHPYNAGWKDGVQSFTVKTDQSTEDGYLNSDLLWATATASPTDLPVNLKFMHKLAKISVTLTSDDFDDLSGAEVSICGTGVSGDFNTATGEFLGVNGAVYDIKAGSVTVSVSTVSAIIIPTSKTIGECLIKITYAGKDYHYVTSKSMEFKSGYSYHYTLKLVAGDIPAVEEVTSGEVEDMEIVEW